MKRTLVSLVAMATAAILVTSCTQAAPAPTQAPPAPTKAVEPTKASAAPTTAPAAPTTAPQPTSAPATKVDFPIKGKAIKILIPYGAGGGTDVGTRIIAPLMEKDLGTSIEIVNQAGAGGQIALTEVATAKPDGHTLVATNLPGMMFTYMDPARKAVYSRQSFTPIANRVFDLAIVAVQADSPYKTLKDLTDAAKANPGKLKLGTSGRPTMGHVAAITLQKLAGVQFQVAHFDGDAPTSQNLLGGHVDVIFTQMAGTLQFVKSGQMRYLAVADSQENKFAPGVKTMKEQGFDITQGTYQGLSGPAGIPSEIAALLSASVKKALSDPDIQKKTDDLGLTMRYMDPKEQGDLWKQLETDVQPLASLLIGG